MTEEQFWHANPRKIKVWEEAHKAKINEQNRLNYINGMYTLSATAYAVDHILNGRKAKSKYYNEPIRIFPKTEKELEQDRQDELKRFVAYLDNLKARADAKEALEKNEQS